MSNQETKQEQIQFSAQQELKHLRTRCGKVYALGNNRFRAVVQTTPVHEYDAATHQWVEMSAEKRQQMAAQAHSPIATFADSANSAENAAGILDTYVKGTCRVWARTTSSRPRNCAFATSTHRQRIPPSCARKC
ncbi:MAG: hypothetical protein KH341_13295 [Faecalibacterium sp.]|nr:hypothetical protein [Faecalibacterium sp.]